jgi:4-amino-4-deoxy-L-arabinose transferase-like glycosyltransferase
LVAGLLVACDPILLNQSTLVMTETLATFLAVLSLWCLARFDTQRAWFNAGLAGGAIGLAILCRPTFLPWLGLVAGAMLLMRGREIRIQNAEFRTGKAAKRGPWWRDVGWRFANVAALLVVAGAVVSPWVIRNYQVFGKPIVATTHGGYTLLLGNNIYFYKHLEEDQTGLPWNAKELDHQPLPFKLFDSIISDGSWDELKADRLFSDQAAKTIRQYPKGCARACFHRNIQLWSPLPNKLTADESPNRRLLRYATAAWYCGVYSLAAIGVWKLRWRLLASPWVWGVLLCVAFIAVHTFYWSNLRMRAPLMPFVAIVASAALLPRPRR